MGRALFVVVVVVLAAQSQRYDPTVRPHRARAAVLQAEHDCHEGQASLLGEIVGTLRTIETQHPGLTTDAGYVQLRRLMLETIEQESTKAAALR